ncbi:MAG: hypothetical protein R2749_29965 [Acidimicrobiales bacterium]
MTVEVVLEVFGLDCELIADPVSGAPIVLPRGRHHGAVARRQTIPNGTD